MNKIERIKTDFLSDDEVEVLRIFRSIPNELKLEALQILYDAAMSEEEKTTAKNKD